MQDLTFGWRTAVLGVVVVQLLAIALGLTRTLANRAANRLLAALLVVLAGIVTPWMIGFAGFYDKWPWLSFAPFAVTLAVAPLLWIHIRSLVTGVWEQRNWLHLTPAATQFAFLTASFALPMPLKDRWSDLTAPWYGIVTDAGTIVGLALYGVASLRLLRAYRRDLAEQRSDDARFAARWLSRAVGATLVLLPVWAIYGVWDAVAPLGYRNLMGLYVAIGAFALYVAVEGWRHAALSFPRIAPIAEPDTPTRDWRAAGETWAAEVRANGWAADPDLSLATLARRLGTNSSYLSRALNEGLGTGFSAFVNGLRSESVADAIRRGDRRDLLDLAFDAGFASKASFNRAFQARFGASPSAWRAHASHPEN